MFHTIKNYYRPFFFDGLLKAAFILLGILATSFIFATKFPTEAPFGFSLSEKKLLSSFFTDFRLCDAIVILIKNYKNFGCAYELYFLK